MVWILAALAAGVAVAALAAAGMMARRRKGRSAAVGTVAIGVPYGSLYGLDPEEAARFHNSVREHTRRHRAQWSRDYLPGAAEGGLPGRISGIPRMLRVRR